MEGLAVDVALGEFERIYAFLLARVGNRPDAEDLTQQVALKALPRLRDSASTESIRAYLFATARSVLGTFWSSRLRLRESELGEEVPDRVDSATLEPTPAAAQWLETTLASLPAHYRQVLELRFLRGSSINEVARDMKRTPGAVKVLQLRALRAAAAAGSTAPSRSRPARLLREGGQGSASAPRLGAPAAAARRR